MNLTEADKAYANDPVFDRMVDVMEMVIDQLELTPSEVRHAANYAAMRVENRRTSVYPMTITKGDLVGG